MEKVTLNPRQPITLEQQAAANVINYMLSQHREIKHNSLYAEVELTINGKPVSFHEMVTAFAGHVEWQVRQKAIALLDADIGLAGVRQALLSASVAIKEAVNKLPIPPEE